MGIRRDPVYTEIEQVALWAQSEAGQRAIQTALAKRRLPAYFDSDLEKALLHDAELQTASGEPIDHVPGWCRKVLERRAADILKRPVVRRRHQPTDDDGNVLDVDEFAGSGDMIADAIAALDLDRLRQQLLWSAGDVTARSSACLTILAVAVARAEPGRRCPAPVGGAGPREAAEWAGLWYSGQRNCFARNGEPDSPAIRKRRSRSVSDALALLRAAHDSQEAEGRRAR